MSSKLSGRDLKKKKESLFTNTNKCCWCGKQLHSKNATLDHLVPRCYGGSNKEANLRLSCFACNNERGNKVTGRYAALVEKSCDFDLFVNTIINMDSTKRDKLSKRYRGLWQ